MKQTVLMILSRILFFTFFLIGLQSVKAEDATFNTSTNILVVPALQINNTSHSVALQLGGDGCFTLLSDTQLPALVASSAVYDPVSLTATLQSVAVDNKLFRATIQFINGCFRVASATEIQDMVVLRYVDAEVTGQVVSGDFNGDSLTDLVFTIRTLPEHISGGNNDMFRVIYGDGLGGFSSTTDIFRIGSSDSNKRGHQLIAGDLDGDSFDDFAISTGQILQAFSGNTGTPQSLFNSTDISGAPLYSVDVDGNGFNDLISIVFGGSTRSLFNLYRKSGNGSFGNVEFISSIDDAEIIALNVGSPVNFTVGDFNGDTINDILSVVLTGSGNDTHLALALFTGKNDGSFNNPTFINVLSDDLFLGEFAFELPSKEIAFGDFDGDGDNDIAITSTTSFLQVFLNDGAGQFTAAQRVQVGNKPIHVRVADFDNDGIEDLMSINANSKTVIISLGNGDGTFADITSNDGRSISFQLDSDVDLFDVDITDLNADGFLDIVIAEDGTNPPDSGRGSIQIIFSPGN